MMLYILNFLIQYVVGIIFIHPPTIDTRVNNNINVTV